MDKLKTNSFGSRSTLRVGKLEFEIFRIDALDKQGVSTRHLPFSLRILLENLLRTEDGKNVTKNDIAALAAWNSKSKPDKEIAFTPSRVLLQDFTGVPAVVDLAAMRDAMERLSGDPTLINPLQPAELVIDHSVQVDEFGTPQAFPLNAELEFIRNKERYAFLRWGQTAFRNLAIVPPDTGIVHQVNLEFLARVVFVHEANGKRTAYPDTLVGTDSHTTMINGLGVLGWGVGGIEAEAAMLGQPVSMLIPQVVGVKLTGKLREGRDRDRSCAYHHRDVAQARRGREVRRVFWSRTARNCRWPIAPPSATCRRSTAPPAAFFRSTKKASTICGSPAAPRNRLRWSRPTAGNRACSTTRRHPRRSIPSC